MKPVLEACYFGADPDHLWVRMATVLRFTAETYCPNWEIQVRHVRPEPMRSALGIPSHVHNTQKMEHWYHVVTGAPDGARLLLMDADTMILRPLDDVWDRDFDIAYTVKEQTRFPFNSGVVFLRVSDRTRAFVEEWRRENRRMLGDSRHHQVWRKQYGGINQAALGYMLSKGDRAGVHLLTLPCCEWNCEDSSWARFDPATTRIVHIKSGLRRAIFFGLPLPSSGVAELTKTWKALERAALEAECPEPANPGEPERAPDRPAPAEARVAPAPRGFRMRGRPRERPEGVVYPVKIPRDTYDAYCRASNRSGDSIHKLLITAIRDRAPQ